MVEVITCQCDNCNKTIGADGKHTEFVIGVIKKSIQQNGAESGMRLMTPQNDAHFCNATCFREWLDKKLLTK